MNIQKKLTISKFSNFSNFIFEKVIDADDIVTLYNSEKILKASPIIYSKITTCFSEPTAIYLLFLSLNLATVIYQNIYSTWFMYLFTSVSGLRKLYKVVLQNPILSIFFYFSFYFRILCETDKQKLNFLAKYLKLPSHENFAGIKMVENTINNLSDILTGKNIKNINDYKLIHKLISEQVIASGIECFPYTIEKKLIHMLKKQNSVTEYINKIPDAVYIKNSDIETNRDFEKFIDYIRVNKKEIENQIKKKIGGKKKSIRKLELNKRIEQQTVTGQKLCLNECKPRIKTKTGCFCDGNCGPSIYGGANWCYVDKQSCKNGKSLPKTIFNSSYDFCDVNNEKTVCYTGSKYRNCIAEDKPH